MLLAVSIPAPQEAARRYNFPPSATENVFLVAPQTLSPSSGESVVGKFLQTPAPGIANIGECPTNDPVYSQIRADFDIRREGSAVGPLTCSEPVSTVPVARWTDELIILQA